MVKEHPQVNLACHWISNALQISSVEIPSSSAMSVDLELQKGMLTLYSLDICWLARSQTVVCSRWFVPISAFNIFWYMSLGLQSYHRACSNTCSAMDSWLSAGFATTDGLLRTLTNAAIPYSMDWLANIFTHRSRTLSPSPSISRPNDGVMIVHAD